MERERRAVLLLALAFSIHPSSLHSQSLTVLDVPFIAQSELLCGGAAAAMVMRYWGERGIDAESFQPLVDPKAGGIRTDVRAIAGKYGIDIRRAERAVAAMDATDLANIAAQARAADETLAGGQGSVTISTTAIIIGLLVLILLIVALN